MARIRSIKPDFWHSADVCALSRDARLLWIGLWNFADDYGNGDARPQQVKIQVFPGDDDISSIDIACLMLELDKSDVGFRLYEVNGKPYFNIPEESWKHQKIDKRSKAKFPEPTDTFPSLFAEYSQSTRRVLDECSTSNGSDSQVIDNNDKLDNSQSTRRVLDKRTPRIGKDRIGEDRIGEESTRARARDVPSSNEVWFSVDTLEKLFDARRKQAGLGRFVLQRSDYDRAMSAVEWAKLTSGDDGKTSEEIAGESMSTYFARAPTEDTGLAKKGLPFWGWANDPSRWYNTKPPQTGPAIATSREDWEPFEDDFDALMKDK